MKALATILPKTTLRASLSGTDQRTIHFFAKATTPAACPPQDDRCGNKHGRVGPNQYADQDCQSKVRQNRPTEEE